MEDRTQSWTDAIAEQTGQVLHILRQGVRNTNWDISECDTGNIGTGIISTPAVRLLLKGSGKTAGERIFKNMRLKELDPFILSQSR